MNKYEKALNDLISFVRKHSLNGYVYGSLFVLQELIDKEDKYRWHDLRKDPNDLPRNLLGKELLICRKSSCGTNYYDLCYHDKKGFNYCDSEYGDIYLDNVLAWKYIEEFENE